MLMHARTWIERLRFSVVDLLKLPGLTLLHRPGSSGQWSLTRSWRLLLDGFPGACPSPRDHSLHEHAPSRSGEPPPSPGHIPRAKHAPAPSHAARCRCPLLVHAPRYPPLTFGRTWRAKPEASHNDPGRYRHLLFELRMLVLFDACGYAYVWSGCAERVLHAHVAVDRLPHFRLLRPISLGGRKCGDTFVMHKHIV